MATSNPQQRPAALPSISSLTNGLLPSSQQLSRDYQTQPSRDSGTWPQPQSKHNSANSQSLHVHTLLNPDDSPPRGSVPSTPQSARIPGQTTSAGSQLPAINQGFENHRDSQHRGSADYHQFLDSRRSSVDSRMHAGFNKLMINHPTSPYESQNVSQVSLAASLRRPNGQAPMSPLSARSSIRVHPPPRIAPPIIPIQRGPGAPDPTAANPTQGYAWAFPDDSIPEEHRGSISDESSTHGLSRQGSFAASSIRSSIFSTDSSMPVGQRRFDDGRSHSNSDLKRSLMQAESTTTHHHSMQHRNLASLQNDGMSPPGIGNYSRTPELRVSHKLAERKRRSEMKDLFEDLNKAVPASGGTKASKWEILTKAIEYIRNTQHIERNLHSEVSRLQRESDYAREAHKENEMLRTEIQVMHQHLRRLDPNAPHVYGHFTSQLNQSNPPPQTNGTTLPPLSAGAGAPPVQYNGVPPPAAMQGVEYGYGR